MGIKNRVVKGLGNLEVGHAFDQLGVKRAGICPEGELFDLITRDMPGNGQRFHHGFFVDINATTREVLHARPLRLLKAGASRQSDVLELGKVGVKAVEDDPREAALLVHWKPFENRQGSVGGRILLRNFRMPPIQRS